MRHPLLEGARTDGHAGAQEAEEMKCPLKELQADFKKERREHPTLSSKAVWTITCDHAALKKRK
jgi:hypothetical protein